jgi:hypothetical protein
VFSYALHPKNSFHLVNAITMQLTKSIGTMCGPLVTCGLRRQGRTPRRKNSTALLTRSDSL